MGIGEHEGPDDGADADADTDADADADGEDPKDDDCDAKGATVPDPGEPAATGETVATPAAETAKAEPAEAGSLEGDDPLAEMLRQQKVQCRGDETS